MGQWSELPWDLLHDLEERLVLYLDKVRFRSVCVSWNSYSPKVKMPDHHQVKPLPWLLHATQDKNSEASHGLFYPIERKVYHLDLPEARGMVFKGSSHGWVVTIEDTIARTGPTMHLINPLTRARIQLPSRSEFPDVRNYRSDKIGSEYAIEVPNNRDDTYFTSPDHVNLYLLHKVVLSATPSREDCVVVAIYGECGRLAYCKCNDKKWTFLFGKNKTFTDIMFHMGKLHALNCWGELLVFENIGPNPMVTQIVARPRQGVGYYQYLVECSDGLMMVERCIDTHSFNVFKHDPSNSSWFEVQNIGGDMIFLGWNLSLSVSSCDFPGYKGNHIYFTDDHVTFELKDAEEGAHIGVFNLEDGSIEALPGYQYDPKIVWPPPIWITPSTF